MRSETVVNPRSLKLSDFQDVLQSVKCINANQHNRALQQKCVIENFSARNEKLGLKEYKDLDKSVFRGMVIPSLRHMALISGYGMIHTSANGFLLSQDHAYLYPEIRFSVMIEAGGFLFNGDSLFKKMSDPEFRSSLIGKEDLFIDQSYISLEKEKRWIRILKDADMAYKSNSNWYIKTKGLKEYYERRIALSSDKSKFSDILLACYNLHKYRSPFVDISALRKSAAELGLNNHNLIITENIFDDCLRSSEGALEVYNIDFGLPMHRQARTFKKGNKYYSTLRLYREEVND